MSAKNIYLLLKLAYSEEKTVKMKYKCQKCGEVFDAGWIVKCPKCGAHDWDCKPVIGSSVERVEKSPEAPVEQSPEASVPVVGK